MYVCNAHHRTGLRSRAFREVSHRNLGERACLPACLPALLLHSDIYLTPSYGEPLSPSPSLFLSIYVCVCVCMAGRAGDGAGGEDHIAVLRQMAERYPHLLDLGRVGIYGHSVRPHCYC